MDYMKNQNDILGHYAQYKPTIVKTEEQQQNQTEIPPVQQKNLPIIQQNLQIPQHTLRFSTYSTVDEAIPPNMKKGHVSIYQHPPMTLYHLGNYSLTEKEPQHEKDKSVPERLLRMEQKYKTEGMKRCVEAVLLTYQCGHPHVLLLQIGTNQRGFYKLPGGRLRHGEDEIKGLKRKLQKRLGNPAIPIPSESSDYWKIGECISTWYRPAFETFMYPYLPAHITKPKECKKLFVVHLPERCDLFVPKNFKLVAVPFYDLYENSKRYGPTISAIPQCVSRFQFNFAEAVPTTAAPQNDEKLNKNIAF